MMDGVAPERTTLAAGAHNLLCHAAGLRAGERLLLVEEDPALGWYDPAAAEAIATEAAHLGAAVTRWPVGGPEQAGCPDLAAAMADHDRVVFLARLGDCARFEAVPGSQTRVMSYARTGAALGSAFGHTDHRAMRALKTATDQALLATTRIEITCPLGTDLSGDLGQTPRDGGGEVGIVRFPLGVPRPLCAAGLRGRVMLARWLTPTGSRTYTPAWVALSAPVEAEIAGGRITALRGPGHAVATARRHHRDVGGAFGLDGNRVHSWHAGLHPACAYDRPAAENPDRWANTVFQSPRFLHVHTCGDAAPGEICWMVADPTVILDGVALWEGGRLHPERHPATRAALSAWPELDALMRHPPVPLEI